jgi:LysR family nitrogen assimilation transcriptional regulator
MEVRELRYFVQVARSGSFSRAAIRLNVVQPALSRQIKKLENELGVPLFVRRPRGVELTQAGSLLLSQAEDLIDHLGRTHDLVRSHEQTFTGHVTLGIAPTSGLLIAPEIFQIFRTKWPHATLLFREGVSSSLEEWLLDRRISLAVLHNPLPLEGIDMIPILHERMVLVTAPGFNLGRTAVRFEELGEIPLILPSLPHGNRRLLERAAMQNDVRLNLILEVDSVPLQKAMVRGGFGATVLTYAGVSLEVDRGELRAHSIERPPLTSTICIGIPREARASWLTMELARILRSCIRDLVANGTWPCARLSEDLQGL